MNKENQPIHPRVQHGKTVGPKVNTCKPRSARNGGRGGKQLRRRMDNLAIRTKDWEALSETSKRGRRRPGSMQ